jgi:hypothetical protein
MYVNGDQAKIRAEGFSLLDMKRFLESRGFLADGYELPLSKLEEAQIPAIVLIVENGYHHFVVVKGVKGDRVLIGDPRAAPAPSSAITSKRSGTASLLFVIHNRTDRARFNLAADWRVAPSGPYWMGVPRDSLFFTVMPKHGPPISELRNIMVQTTISSASRCTAGRNRRPCCWRGLACAGNAHAGVETLAPESADTAGVATPVAIDLPAMPTPTQLSALSEDPHGGACRRPHRCGHVANVPGELSSRSPKRLREWNRWTRRPWRGITPPRTARGCHDNGHADPGAQVAEARDGMAKWKPVAQARLEESRGGFDVAGLQVGFGIDRAVFVNGALAVATSITIPDISSITSAQAAQLAQALAPVTVAVTAANSIANAAIAAAQAATGQAGQAGQSATTAANGAAASAQGAAGVAASTSSAAASGGIAQAAGAAGVAQAGRGRGGGHGRHQRPADGDTERRGNTANVGAVSNMPATVIQNNLNNQNIQSLMTLNASVNTLAAFRAQMANTALNSVIPTMAGMK